MDYSVPYFKLRFRLSELTCEQLCEAALAVVLMEKQPPLPEEVHRIFTMPIAQTPNGSLNPLLEKCPVEVLEALLVFIQPGEQGPIKPPARSNAPRKTRVSSPASDSCS